VFGVEGAQGFNLGSGYGAFTDVGMMEENQRGRIRALPVSALEGRLEALVRRGVLALSPAERDDIVAIAHEGERSGADSMQVGSQLVAWFTRREREKGIDGECAVRRSEAYVDYLLDLEAEGEMPAFGKLSQILGSLGGAGGSPGHAV
jgi:hypothetical protein